MTDGGPAFPCEALVDQHGTKSEWEGMTLRDYFAAKAMQALMRENYFESTARSAYHMADIMLKERLK
jgi:hypothetical protein